MSTHKHIDRICCAALVTVLVLTLIFVYAGRLGVQAVEEIKAYETKLFDTSKVHTIEIVMDDWEGFLEECTNEEYVACSLVIDQDTYKNVAIRAKGNTSLTSVASYGNNRYSFKIEFDHYDNSNTYYGLDKFCLNNMIQDNTYMKDYVTYQMMKDFGVAAPLCSYAYITVNGEDFGLYLAVEGIEESFLQRNYGNNYGELYKPDSMDMGGGRGNGAGFDPKDLGEISSGNIGEEISPVGIESGTAGEVPSDGAGNELNGGIPPAGAGNEAAGEVPSDGAGNELNGGIPSAGAGNELNGEIPPAGAGNELNGEIPSAGAGNELNGEIPPAGAGNEADGEVPPARAGMAPGASLPEDEAGKSQGEERSSAGAGTEVQEGDRPDAAGAAISGDGVRPEGMPDRDGDALPAGKEFGAGSFAGSEDVSLIYTDDEYDSYSNIFDNAKTDISDQDKQRLIASVKSLNEQENLEHIVDMEAVIRYFVVHNFVCNFDSYTGSMIHNYYLYEKDGQLSMIPWDYNLAFGGFQSGTDADELINYPIDSPVFGGTIASRPMLAWIFSEEEYTELYHQYFEEFIRQYFSTGVFETMVDSVQKMISPYVEKDPGKFCTYEEFEEGAATLKSFCLLRAESIEGQLAGTIASTQEGQRTDASELIDGEELSVETMGTMGNPGGMEEGRGGPEGTDRTAYWHKEY